MFKFGCAALAGVGVASVPAALAQAVPDIRVVVTATQQSEDISELPASVHVIDQTATRDINSLTSAEEIVGLVPGLQAAVANGVQVAYQIRGVGAVDHQALTPTAAAVYLDGVYLATNVQTGLLGYDLERVEVMRGPQGTLFGRNASGGAINFRTVRPDADQTSYLQASVGTFERYDLASAVGGSLGENVHLRLAGRYLSQDATLDNVLTDPAFPLGPDEAGGRRDEFGLRASALWDVGVESSVLLRAHYEEDNGVNPAPRNSSLSVGDHEISVGPDGVQDTDNEFYGASVEGQTAFGAWTLDSLTSVEGYNQQYGFDFDGSQALFSNPAFNANLSYDRDFLQVAQDFSLAREWAGGSTLIGLHAAQEDFEQLYTIWCGVLNPVTLVGSCNYVGAAGRVGPAPASTAPASTLLTDIEQTRTTAALFSYNDFDLSDRLTLTIGARYTFEDIDGSGSGRHVYTDGAVALNNRNGLGAATGSNEIREYRLTGNAALRYRIADDGMAYVSVSNGYKSGGFNGEVQNDATHFQDEGLFAAETVTNWEAGFKATPSATASWSVAAFYQDYEAPQARIFVQFPLPGGGSIISNSLSNLDAAESIGLEGEFSWRPVRGLDLVSGFTLLDTEIMQESDAAGTGNAALFDGNPLPFSSEVSLTLGARYEWALDADQRFALQSNAKYQSPFYLDAEGRADRRQDEYTLLDASASWYLDRQGLELSVWGRNLLDEDYAVSGYGFIGYNTFRSQPAMYGVTLRYER